ncbi:MAG: hypothetical protein AAF747_09665 [Planctomycetota bacterium]
MAAKRSHPPLFELLGDNDRGSSQAPTQAPSRGSSHASGQVSGDALPAASVDTEAPPPRPSSPSDPAVRGGVSVKGGVLRMDLPYALVLLAVLVAAGIGIYSLGFSAGRQAAIEAGVPRAMVLDPLDDETPSGNRGAARESDAQGVPAGNQDTGNAGEGGSTPVVLTASGTSRIDPRLAEHNYYRLTRVFEEDARLVLAALDDAGLGGFAVLDRSGRGRNNRSLYVVYLDVAIAGGAFASSSDERRRLQRLVGAVGDDLKAAGGPGFVEPIWERYNGS